METLPSSIASGYQIFLMPPPNDPTIESKIAHLKGEIRFYWQLVSWLIFVSHEDCLPVLKIYRADLAVFRSTRLPALQRRLAHLQERKEEDQRAALAHLRRHLYRIEMAFRLLKSDLQHHFIEFIHVSIW